jgi:SAM-dependent methyltransferase
MLQQARKRPFQSLTCGNVEKQLPFPNATYHAIICVGVMDFIISPEKLLQEILRVSKPGILGISFPDLNLSPEGVRNGKQVNELNAWTRKEIEEMIHRNGWWIERHERMHGYLDSTTQQMTWYHCYLLQSIDTIVSST